MSEEADESEEAGPITKCVFSVVRDWATGEPWYVLEVHRDEDVGFFYLSGTAHELAVSFVRNKTPFGVFLDRLEECPDEADEGHSLLRPELLEAVKWLRANAPDGIKRRRWKRS